MTTPMRELEWLAPLADEQRNRELERYVKQRAGLVPPYTRYFGACPWIMRADIDLDIGLVHVGDLADLIYLVVSRDNSCRFCYAGARMLMRMGGRSEEQILGLERDIEQARVEPRTRLALEYARRVSRANPPPDETDQKALRELGFSDAAIRELAFFAADVIFHNRFATLLALPPQPAESLASSRLLGVVKLRFRRLLGRLAAEGRPEALDEALKTGPYSEVVLALDGLPHARVLRKILDEAWDSPHLSRRAKALVFAVIARGLGSSGAEREAFRLLAEEGLTAAQVEEILAHLSSPLLDPLETRILPYVRDTVWYQATPLQRRGRELREHLSNAQMLETVGVAALANMVGRLALVFDGA